MRPGRCPPSPLRPGEGRAVGVGRVGGGQADRRRLAAVVDLAERAQPVDRARGAELGGAQPLDEVAAPAAAGVLERREHLVDRREAAGQPLADHRAAGDDAVPVEQPLGRCVRAAGRVGVELGEQRPAAGGLGRPGAQRRAAATGGRGHPGPGGRPLGAVAGGAGAGERPERGEGVVADPAGPDEVPQGGAERLVVGRADLLRRAGGRTTRRPARARRARPGGARCARTARARAGSAAPGRRGGARPSRRSRAARRGRPRAPRRRR